MSKTYLIFPKVLKGMGAVIFKFYSMQYQNCFSMQYRPTGDKIDGIIKKRRIFFNLTSLRMNRYRNQCAKKYLEQINEVDVEI